MEKIEQMLGHRSIKTTIDVYAVPSVADTREEFEADLDKASANLSKALDIIPGLV